MKEDLEYKGDNNAWKNVYKAFQIYLNRLRKLTVKEWRSLIYMFCKSLIIELRDREGDLI